MSDLFCRIGPTATYSGKLVIHYWAFLFDGMRFFEPNGFEVKPRNKTE